MLHPLEEHDENATKTNERCIQIDVLDQDSDSENSLGSTNTDVDRLLSNEYYVTCIAEVKIGKQCNYPYQVIDPVPSKENLKYELKKMLKLNYLIKN